MRPKNSTSQRCGVANQRRIEEALAAKARETVTDADLFGGIDADPATADAESLRRAAQPVTGYNRRQHKALRRQLAELRAELEADLAHPHTTPAAARLGR